jgi:hypothetical protein
MNKTHFSDDDLTVNLKLTPEEKQHFDQTGHLLVSFFNNHLNGHLEIWNNSRHHEQHKNHPAPHPL